MSKELKFLPFTTSKPLFGQKFSSTPKTEISGSVFFSPYFTSMAEPAVKEREVVVNGKSNLS